MTLTVIYIWNSENDLKMTDFITHLKIVKMTYGVWGIYKIL